MTGVRAAADPATVQRRTLGVLGGSVALAGIGVTVGITVGGLLAAEVAGTEGAAGLGQSAGVLGAALLAVPLARISDRAGRRAGLATGYLVALAGALLAVLAAVLSSLLLLLVGLVCFGAATACGLQSRYAAADLAVPEHRGRALSLVVWATTVGSVLGPNLAGPGADLARAVGLPPLSGGFLIATVVFGLVAAGLVALLRPDPLLLARRLGGHPPGAPTRPRGATAAALRAVWSSPGGRVGLTAVVVAHAVMVGVMVMTPVHMGHAGGGGGGGGAELRIIGLVISVHVAGMYLFSPLVGQLADRLGRRPVVGLAGGLLLAAAALAGTADPGAAVQLGAGLLLLGLGWSCGLIAGSTLVTESVDAGLRPTAQGGADLLMGLAAAAAGLAGGPLLALGGYGLVCAVSAGLLVPLLVVWLRAPGLSGRGSSATGPPGS